ncbi:glucosamine--fructose-6-phosphate aminotransferase [endosymbiont of Ridgeia piscesae]|uniref:Uncharacterized protein n=1 Tax=endosymbiont of Ridgeia piscesae TaxID=54398 RepID=A0A0T5ZBK5_9GAMM|nr:glucosamine--fructose-6-phosphate aminotransferase [endosymbiont of Ridgeia piscesae]KRT60240.1 hypothetical protein Ga0076813_16908 [endosymbiont of Ridgeia piscesae]
MSLRYSMVTLPNALQAWGSERFSQILKSELESLSSGSLPLEKGISQGGLVDDSNISVTVLNFSEVEDAIRVMLGVFFTEIVGGCSCGDDPLEANGYCELRLEINKSTAEAGFKVV